MSLSACRLVAIVAAFATLLACASAQADLVFTSVPPTQAVVGQAYAYKMTARDDDGNRFRGRIRFSARALPRWLRFDGSDTLYGTPRAGDLGTHRVRLRARVRGDHVDQNFVINVAAAPSAPPPADTDLAVLIAVAPNAIAVDEAATWKVTARNLSDADVGNFAIETTFSGTSTFTIDGVDDAGCAVEFHVDHTAVICRGSPLVSGAARSAEIVGRASTAGEILAVARVSITDRVPQDRDAANDESSVVLDVIAKQPSDIVPPVLTLNGVSPATISVGETYQDPGATALDDIDGDLTSWILVDNPVDTSIIGRYSVTYDVADTAGNLATATRTVEVTPREPTGGGGGGAAGIALLLLASCGAFARRMLPAFSRRTPWP